MEHGHAAFLGNCVAITYADGSFDSMVFYGEKLDNVIIGAPLTDLREVYGTN